jgi:LPS export ABC transporter protein LptC
MAESIKRALMLKLYGFTIVKPIVALFLTSLSCGRRSKNLAAGGLKIIIVFFVVFVLNFYSSFSYPQEIVHQIKKFDLEKISISGKVYTIKAPLAFIYKDGSANCKKIEVKLWQDNKPIVVLSSKKAKLDKDNNIFFEGNVKIDSVKGGKLFTDKLEWCYKTETVSSDTFTKIYYGDSVLYARKLKALPDLRKIYLYNLKGTVFPRKK